MPQLVQVNLIKNPTISKTFEFSRQKKMCAFFAIGTENVVRRTRSLRVFLQIVCLNNFNEKVIMKRIGGNFEWLEIRVQLLIKKKLVS